MELGDLLVKIANNARLTPQEMDVLKRIGNETQQRNSFVAGNTTPTNQLALNLPIVLLYSETLQNTTAQININIPSNYNHILLVGSGRSDVGAVGSGVGFVVLRFNGDTGSNYAYTYDGVAGSVFDKAQALTTTRPIIGQFPGTTITAQSTGYLFGMASNLRSNTLWKSFIVIDGSFYDAGVASYNSYGIWKSTSPAEVANLTVYDTAATQANFVAGTQISVFGLL